MIIREFHIGEELALVAYGDLQTSGYIDHFYVAGAHARRGIGSALLQHICGMAPQRGIADLTSDVSLCAESFFVRHGFSVVQRKTVVVRRKDTANSEIESLFSDSYRFFRKIPVRIPK